MKRVLLLGDSIRLNYMPVVFMNLQGRAEVVGPNENCRFAKYTLCCLEDWLNLYGTPDIVHWNNGIWDASYFCDRQVLTSLDEYRSDMLRIYERLRKTGAKIIFATVTPCVEPVAAQENVNLDRYNAAAVELLKDRVDDVNDLHNFVKENIDEFICEDHIHLSKTGIRAVGNRVTQYIEKYL